MLAVVGARVDEALLDLLPDLRLVANYGVGYDGIDVAACEQRGVAVTNTPGVLDAATAVFESIEELRGRLDETPLRGS